MKKFLVFIVYLAVVLFLYWPIASAFFVSDDFDWLNRAQNISLTAENLFLRSHDNNVGGGVYRPLTSFSFWLNYQLGGLNPTAYHSVNIILHALNAFLLFYLLCLLTRKKKLAFLAGLFFVILPNHPEAVSWISGRGDVLCAFFYLLSLVWYVLFRERGRARHLVFSLLAFFLALGAKEMAITLPALIIIYELLWQFRDLMPGRRLIKNILHFLPFVALLALYLFLRWESTRLLVGFYAAPALQPKLQPMAETLVSAFLSVFMGSPWRQSALLGLQAFWLWAALAATSALFLLGMSARNKHHLKEMFFGWLFFIITAGPILPLKFSWLTDEGDRFGYLPSLSIAIVLALVVYLMLSSRKTILAGWFLVIILGVHLSYNLYVKNLYWAEAGRLSHDLLYSFGQSADVTKKQGIVIMGLPDNLVGAQVFRNGWSSAVGLYYPSYVQDMLVVKTGFNYPVDLSNQSINWQVTRDGYIGSGSKQIFRGQENLNSLDYQMLIKNYKKDTQSGSVVEYKFTLQFQNQLKAKTIKFLAVKGLKLEEIPSFFTSVDKGIDRF
jgi:hypothetical protein